MIIMTDEEIYKSVENYIISNLKDKSFDKGLPFLQKYVWDLGDKVGKTGPEIMKIYLDYKSKKQ